MKQSSKSSLTQKATQALTDAVAKAVEEHRRRGIPLAVWRNGKAVSIPASEAATLRESSHPYRNRSREKCCDDAPVYAVPRANCSESKSGAPSEVWIEIHPCIQTRVEYRNCTSLWFPK
jgi:hypothetical protein